MSKLVLAVFMALSAPAALVGAQAEPPQVEDFWERADFFRPAISANGQYLAYVKREGEDQYVVTIDLNDPKGDMKSVPVGKVAVRDLDWITDERLLVSVTGYLGRRTGKSVSREKVREVIEEGGDWRRKYRSENQSIVMDRDGKNAETMFADSALRKRDGFEAELVYDLPSDPNHIIMSAKTFDRDSVRNSSIASYNGEPLELYKVNIKNGREQRMERGTEDTTFFFVDRNGDAVLRWDGKDNNLIFHAYAKQNGKWVKVKEVPADTLQSNGGEAFRPLGPAADSGKYYVFARPEGQKQVNMYLYDFNTDTYGPPIKTRSGVDLQDASFNRNTQELQSVTFSGDREMWKFEDPTDQAHYDGLQEYLGADAVIRPYATDAANTKWLLTVLTPTQGITYFLYDKAAARTTKLGNPRSALEGKTLATVDIVKYTARDGLPLVGYLTRPANAPKGTKLPLVMLPHGGPEARDEYGFDVFAQVIASGGYQVFQPQFRGSSGFGLDFADKGRRQWGKAMQNDVDDGFDHLVKMGLADADKACLMGFSYGGYAAFAAATLTPDKYQCILAGAGVSDLIKMQEWELMTHGSATHPVPAYWNDHIGNIQKDRDALIATSPARLADRITKPMFIFHGEEDQIVPIEQSRIMMGAMDAAGKPYEWHMMRRTGHSFGNSAARSVETFEKALAFLNKHLPPARL